MDLGDIVSDSSGQRFVVSRLHEDNTCLLLNRTDTEGVTVHRSSETYRVEANPYRDWPFLVLPSKTSKYGILNQVGVPNQLTETVFFEEFKDWLLGHPSRSGGALYLRPELGLQYRDRVVLVFSGKRTSVPVPLEFRTVSNRVVAASIRRMLPKDRDPFYDQLMQDDDDEKA